MSVLIHVETDSLLNCAAPEHDSSCRCGVIRRYYGKRPFKCSFSYCQFRREGFESRAARISHQRYHDRPWKCSVPNCAFVEGGFLSRKMRDDHLNRFHQEQGPNQDSDVLQSSPGEVKELLFDLVQANNFEAVKALLPSFRKLDWAVQDELRILSAASGPTSLLDLLITTDRSSDINIWRKLAISAIKSNNTKNFEYILKNALEVKSRFTQRITGVIFGSVLKSDSMEIYEVWEKYTDAQLEAGNAPNRVFVEPEQLAVTLGHPHREQLVLNVWKNKGVMKALDKKSRGDALVYVAQSCCSIRLAKYLINAGAEVDHRRSEYFRTSLHHAARKTSAEAAELMKYLLQRGADPELKFRNKEESHSKIGEGTQSVRDEKGAKQISKWLGISWDELMEQTRKERDRIHTEVE